MPRTSLLFTDIKDKGATITCGTSVDIPKMDILENVTHLGSSRIRKTYSAAIEDICNEYEDVEGLESMGLGSTYWTPPEEALERLKYHLCDKSVSKYSSIMGYKPLREALREKVEGEGLCMNEFEVMITCGAQQAFINAATVICDDGDHACLLAPYYMSHQLALQMLGCEVSFCLFDESNVKPRAEILHADSTAEHPPRIVVLTNPGNPSGTVLKKSEIASIVNACKKLDCWLVVDATYSDITFAPHKHVWCCAKQFGYKKIIHVGSFSKNFGMPGWRVGYVIYPKCLTGEMRKVQDTVCTHPSVLSQKLAFFCLQVNAEHAEKHGISWIETKVSVLKESRDLLYSVLSQYRVVKPQGAFYFLVPLPEGVSDDVAVYLLARKYRVLVMPGCIFGAAGWLRVSFGNGVSQDAAQRLDAGMKTLFALEPSLLKCDLDINEVDGVKADYVSLDKPA